MSVTVDCRGHSAVNYKSVKTHSYNLHSYKTHYSRGYCTTCARSSEGKIKRSESAKKNFLKSKGYNSIPAGYQVDHVTPLYKGGSDTPSNMQLIPTEVHKQKTSEERKY